MFVIHVYVVQNWLQMLIFCSFKCVVVRSNVNNFVQVEALMHKRNFMKDLIALPMITYKGNFQFFSSVYFIRVCCHISFVVINYNKIKFKLLQDVLFMILQQQQRCVKRKYMKCTQYTHKHKVEIPMTKFGIWVILHNHL